MLGAMVFVGSTVFITFLGFLVCDESIDEPLKVFDIMLELGWL